MELNCNNVLIFGYGTSGKSVQKILMDKKISYKIYDDDNVIDGGIYIYHLTKKMLRNFDLIVLSPGVSIYHPKIKLAQKMGIKVISELEFGSYFCEKEIIAVTGTNGKTTVVSLLHHIFTNCGVNAGLLGNVGTPFSENYFLDHDVYIVEVSSFQLEAIECFHPHIAVLLNVSCDHIDRHKTMNNYIQTKLKMFQNCTMEDLAILPTNTKINFESVKGTQFFIGNTIKVEDDEIVIYLENEKIVVCNKSVFNPLSIPMENILNSILVSFLYGLNLKDIVDAMCTFKPLGNRVEKVQEKNGVIYVNDSKATNIGAMENAIKCYKDKSIYLLLGGYDKKLDFKEFCNNIPLNIVKIVLFSTLGKRLKKCLKKANYTNFVYFSNLKKAIEYCVNTAEIGSVVLLSPASSSFDEFSNYRERGEFFCKTIEELK